MQTYYLNNNGSRWINLNRERGKREKIPVKLGGITKQRTIQYWEACGNFAFPSIRIKGKNVAVYPNSDVECSYYMTYQEKYGEKIV